MNTEVRLGRDASDNGFAMMLTELVRQNLEAKPQKRSDLRALRGQVAIVADDADVAVTLSFAEGGRLTVHDGIVGIPDVTIRGPTEVIMALSNLPLRTPLGLPIPERGDREAANAVRVVLRAVREGQLHIYGLPFHLGLVAHLTRVMSIHG